MTFRSLLSLRNLLMVDAATCAGTGILLALAAGPLGALTDIPSTLLFVVGIALLPIALFMAVVAARPAHAAIWLIILGNALWVAGSLLLLLGPWITPNALGAGFIVVQAAAVAALAWFEHAALRGTPTALVAG